MQKTRRDCLSSDKATSLGTSPAGGRVGTGHTFQPGAKKSDVIAAARHCVALDDSGQFQANHALGLFETEAARVLLGTPRVTAASVEFIARPRRKKVDSACDDTAPSAGIVGVKLLLEVDGAKRWDEGDGEESKHSARGFGKTGELVPTRGDVEMMAAAATAAVSENPAEAQVAISALAAWNLVMESSAQGKTPASPPAMIRIEVGAAFGYHGDWYAAVKTVPLSCDDSSGSVVRLSASFEWQPTGDVWAELDGPAVADVKVYGASSAFMKQEELLVLHSTLCKRASGRGERGVENTADEATPAAMQATLVPYAERMPVVAAEPVVPAAAASSTRPSVVVSEIHDGDWWKAREEARGRGMDAVNALPRLLEWKPGDWRKRRKRRRGQEQERERRRGEEAARRRGNRRGDDGGEGTASRDGRNRRRGATSATSGRPKWGAVKGAWRTVRQGWRKARRKFRRKFRRKNSTS